MSGWGSAIKKPWAGVPGGAHIIPAPPREPKRRPEPPEVEYSDEELMLCARYYTALLQMSNEDKRYKLNTNTFVRWDTGQRLKWIYAIEQQALDELNTIGVHVVTRVIMNRLE